MEHVALTPRGRIRRKVIAAGVLTVLAFVTVIPMLSSGATGTIPSSDINDYVLFAVQTLQLKGGGTAGRSVIDGNIGAGTKHWVGGYAIPTSGGTNEFTTGNEWLKKTWDSRFLQPAASGTAHLALCQGSGDTGHLTLKNSLDPSTPPYIVAPSMNVQFGQPSCQIPSAYGLGNLDIMPISIWHTITNGGPDIQIPALPTVNCSNPLTLTASNTNPNPGTYWGYTVPKTATLTLKKGTYNFCGDLKVLNNAHVVTDPGTVINVTGLLNVDVGSGGAFGKCGTTVNVAGTVNFGSNTTITGTIIAPKADVALGNGTNITGHVWAFAMHSDWGVNVTQCPPPPPPPSSSSTTTTTVAPPTTLTTTTSTTVAPPTTLTTTSTTVKTTTSTTVAPPTTIGSGGTTTTLGDT